jgi:hypothetical protein
MTSFIKYVDSMWIGELNHRTKLRKRPSFPHEMWNKFEATLNGDHKTNNLVEGFNNGFKLSLPPKASDWTVIDRFRTEESWSKLNLQKAALGNTVPDQRRSQSPSAPGQRGSAEDPCLQLQQHVCEFLPGLTGHLL